MAWLRGARHTLWLLRTLPPGASEWMLRRRFERKSARARRLARALAEREGRLIFVCHGNIMRSAFAAAVARQTVPQHARDVQSCGTHANSGGLAERTALVVAEEMGVSLEEHRSSNFTDLQLSADDLVVCMDRGNEARVIHYLGQGRRVFLVGDIDVLARAEHAQPVAAGMQTGSQGETVPGGRLGTADGAWEREVPDPFGKGAEVTREAFARLSQRAAWWARRYFDQGQAQQ